MNALLLFATGLLGPAMKEGPHVQSVKVVVADIAAELARPLEVDRSLAALPILVDEPGRKAEQRLNDLVFALHASLVRDGKALRIERSAEDRAALAVLHRRAWSRAIGDSLALRNNRLKLFPPTDDPRAQEKMAQNAVDKVLRDAREAKERQIPYAVPAGLIDPGSLTAAGRLTFDLACRMGPERLADRGSREVRFFSDRPNSLESPLPDCKDLFATYDRRRAASRIGSPLSPIGQGNEPRKTILRVDESGVFLQLFDARGQLMDAGGLDYANRAVVLGPEAPLLDGPTTAWRPLEGASRGLASFLHVDGKRLESNLVLASRGRSAAERPPAPFLHPEAQEPLDFAVREGFLGVKRASNSPALVAVLADWTIDLADECIRRDGLNIDAFARGLFRGGDGRCVYGRISHEGITVLRPDDPLDAEVAVADRKLLGVSMRRIFADGRIDPRNWSAAHFALYASRRSSVARRYLSALLVSGIPRAVDLNGGGTGSLALIGAALASGRAIIEGRIPQLRNIVREGLLDRWLQPKPLPGVSDLQLAPSTLLASGALDRATIMPIATQTMVADRGAGPESPFSGLEPDRLGTDTIYPPGFPRSEARTKSLIEAMYLKPRYRIGRRLVFGAEVRIEGSVPLRFVLTDSIVDRTDVLFDALPQAFRDGIIEGVRKELDGSPAVGLTP